MTSSPPKPPLRSTWMPRIGILLFLAITSFLIWASNAYFTQRFSEGTRQDAESQMALYSGRLVSELQRNSVVPLLLSRDTTLISALNSSDFVGTSQRLISYKEEIGAKSIVLLDNAGRTVAASDRRELARFCAIPPISSRHCAPLIRFSPHQASAKVGSAFSILANYKAKRKPLALS